MTIETRLHSSGRGFEKHFLVSFERGFYTIWNIENKGHVSDRASWSTKSVWNRFLQKQQQQQQYILK